MDALASRISAATLDGQISRGKIRGVIHTKRSPKRTGSQGEAGTNTGSGKFNSAVAGTAGKGKARTSVSAQPVLATNLPKKHAEPGPMGPPKSKFVLAFEAAKKTHQISTNSRAAASGARKTSSPSASSTGAGID